MNRGAIHLGIEIGIPATTTAAQEEEQGCGLQNYSRPLLQRFVLLALMKDARGGSHR
ncbi:hypothetical protein [Aquincola agrisoli]|uniref:hypothetical protein n=1 Tax=Aquincola agrisoli TaxID=3119538 RepID=UPI002FBD4CC7